MEEGELWQRWQHERSIEVRDALIMHYSTWSRLVARDVYMRVYRMRDAWHDCVQNALIGLIEAIDRYDASRGIAFRSYARLRIRGAVFDGLRALQDSTAQIRGHAAVLAAKDRLESLTDEEADDQLSAFVVTTIGLGLGFLLDAHSMPGRAEPPDVYAELERAELSATVGEAVDRLPKRERSIMVLHYYHQLPFVEVAAQLGVTKGRISQLHKRGLDHLRRGLRERFEVKY